MTVSETLAQLGAAAIAREGFPKGQESAGDYRLRLSRAALTAALSDQVVVPRPLSEWHEDMGAMLWWAFPIEEPPYCGTPNDLGRDAIIQFRTSSDQKEHQLPSMRVNVGGWPGYHTHFTPILLPVPPPSSTAGDDND